MKKIDPIIINYKNLSEADRLIIQAKLDVLKIIKEERREFAKGIKGANDMNRILYETAVEVTAELEGKIRNSIIEDMADKIDAYDYCVEDQDTDDYFFGLEGGGSDE